MKSILILFVFVCLFSHQLNAQNNASILPPSDKIKPQLVVSDIELANQHIQLIKDYLAINVDSCKYHYSEAIRLSEKLAIRELEAEANFEMGNVLRRKRKFKEAIDYNEKGLQISKELNDFKLLSEANRQLGNIQWDLSNLKEALTHFTKSKEFAEQAEDPKAIGKVLISFGTFYIDLEEYDKALSSLKEALIYFKQSNSKLEELYVINNISWAYIGLEDYQSALKVIEEKMVDGRFSDDKTLNLYAQSKYGIALIETGQVGRGFDIILKAKEEATQLKLYSAGDWIIMVLTSYYVKFNLFDQAIETALEGISLGNKNQRIKYLPSLYSELAKAYESKKDYKKSLFATEKSIKAKEELLRRQKEKEILRLEMQYQVKQKEVENNLLLLKNTNQKILIGLLTSTFLLFSSFLFFYFHKKERNQINKFKQRIAADLHDDVGGNLSAISRIAKGLKSKNNFENINDDIDQLVKKSNESIRNVVDVVWSLNEEESKLGFLLDKMEDELDGIRYNNKNVKIEFLKNRLDENLSIPMDVRHHLLMIFKESVNNIQKHTQSNLVQVKLDQDGKKLKISICNKFDQLKESNYSTGKGIENIRRRVKELKGFIDVNKTVDTFLLTIVVYT